MLTPVREKKEKIKNVYLYNGFLLKKGQGFKKKYIFF